MLAVGNDEQFRRFCGLHPDLTALADDPRYATNRDRVTNRFELVPLLKAVTAQRPRAYWIEAMLELDIPGGPIQTLPEVFADPQVLHRGMRVRLPAAGTDTAPVSLIGNPIHMSRTPPTYDRPPPRLGEHTAEVLRELGLPARGQEQGAS